MEHEQTTAHQSEWTIERAFSHCRELTTTHYENFPVGSWCVPAAVRPHYYSIYAFARIADDFADERRDVEEQHRLLDDWERRLKRCLNDHENHPVFVALAETIRAHQLPVQWLSDLLHAFRMDVEVRRYLTFSDVLEYCRYSANPVGRLVLALFGYRDEERQRMSDAICTALQLANHWQDVAIDLRKNRIYLPLGDLKRFGVSEEELFAGRLTESFQRLMAFQVDRARALFLEGAPLPGTVTYRLAWELRCVWRGGVRILDRLSANRYDVFQRRPVITAGDKARILAASLLGWPLATSPARMGVGAAEEGMLS